MMYEYITQRITRYKNTENTPVTFITSLSGHRIIRWPHYIAQKYYKCFVITVLTKQFVMKMMKN